MTVKFKMGKVTKHTTRFAEVLGSELSAPKIGTIYVPKATLGAIGWLEGKQLIVELDAEDQV